MKRKTVNSESPIHELYGRITDLHPKDEPMLPLLLKCEWRSAVLYLHPYFMVTAFRDVRCLYGTSSLRIGIFLVYISIFIKSYSMSNGRLSVNFKMYDLKILKFHWQWKKLLFLMYYKLGLQFVKLLKNKNSCNNFSNILQI